MLLCAAMCFFLFSCENHTSVSSSSGSGGSSSGGTRRDSTSIEEENDSIEGVVSIYLSNDNNFDSSYPYGYVPKSGIESQILFPNGYRSGYVFITHDNNFAASGWFNELYEHAGKSGWGRNFLESDIVDLGEQTMSKVKTLPTVGWGSEVAVLLRHSYVYRYKGDFTFVEYNEDHHPTGYEENFSTDYFYKKIYVQEWTLNKDSDIIGALVQYVDWNPNPEEDSTQVK